MSASDELKRGAAPEFLDQLRVATMQRQTAKLRTRSVDVTRTKNRPLHVTRLGLEQFHFAQAFVAAVTVGRVVRGLFRLWKLAPGGIEDEISRDENEMFRP